MPGEDQEWYRNYAVFYKDSPSAIEALEHLIAVVQNERNLSRSAALRAIFDAGVEILMKDPTFGLPAIKEAIAEARLFQAIVLEAKRQQARVQAFNFLGPLGIMEIAGKLGIDSETTRAVIEACESAAVPGRTMPPSQAYKLWISNYLRSGEAFRHEQILRDAVLENILPDPDTDPAEYARAENTFRQVASQMGVSGGRRGWWSLPNEPQGGDTEPF